MIITSDIRTVILTSEHLDLCRHHASLCSIGGDSHVRASGNDRSMTLNEDQLVGQVCTLAGTIVVCGSVDHGTKFYDNVRKKQNLHPLVGDGGDDLPPYRVDVKGSKVRNLRKDVLTYNLVVPPAELHKNLIYVLALTIIPKVAVMGWAYDTDLSSKTERGGVFNGKHTFRAFRLRPMSSLRAVLKDRV